MPAQPGLIATITIALAFAFVGGFLARKARLPPIVGYLAAGIAIGPFTPGLVADVHVASELAEIGVILLMFGVGIHLSFRDLLRVRAIALPGALGQIAVATLLTVLVTHAWGWTFASGLVLGLAISVASTVVLLRVLIDRDALDTAHGHIAVGWLVVEDLVTVLVLVLLPAFAVLARPDGAAAPDLGQLFGALALTIARVGALALVMFFIGARALPWLLEHVAKAGSGELFTLAVLALALGIAFVSATIFGASLALGAFLAGAALSESDVGHHAASEALPLRDAFAVLFFVSVGMLFNPALLLGAPFAVLTVVLLILGGKSLVALAIVLAFGYPLRTALTVAVGLAQIGEFSFILSNLGQSLELLPREGHDLILAGALVTISINPLLFRFSDSAERWLADQPFFRAFERRRGGVLAEAPAQLEPRRHVVLCGYGRVGSVVGETLTRRNLTFVVIEQDRRLVERLRQDGVLALYGDAGDREMLRRAGVTDAAVLLVAISDPVTARSVVDHARALRSDLYIVARTHTEEEWRSLRAAGADVAIWSERELAIDIAVEALRRYGVSPQEIAAITRGLRRL